MATTLVAFRIHGVPTEAVRIALERLITTTGLLGDGVALAWAAMALDSALPGGEG